MKQTQQLPKWLRIAIPSALIIIWLTVAGVGGPYFGRIDEVSEIDLASFLPENAEATKVNKRLKEFRDTSTLSGIVVFESKEAALSGETKQSINDAASMLAKISAIKGMISPTIVSDDGKAAFAVLPIDSKASFSDVLATVRTQLADAELKDVKVYVTGPAGFSADLNKAFSGIDGLLLVVALAAVFFILLLVYRSPLLPIVVLLTSMFALTASILVVWLLAYKDVVQLNGQVQGILFILVIGAATDYSLLYVSRYREELYRRERTLAATKAALKASFEPILASGGTVIVGLLCLLFSDLASNKALGPVGSIGIFMAMLAALTFLPAILYAFGRASFWPFSPRATKSDESRHVKQLEKGVWPRLGRLIDSHPRRVWMTTTGVLLIASVGLLQLKADGVPQSDLILGYSEAREGQVVLDDHFPAGSGSPAQAIVTSGKQDQAVAIAEKDRGVEEVSITTNTTQGGFMPLGTNRPAVKEVDGKILLAVTLKDTPDSEAAENTVQRLRSELRAADSAALVGGTTAVSLDTKEASIRDRAIIIPIVLAAITIILMLLLRSIVAPLLLLATTVLSFGAALGVSAILFNQAWNFPGADPSVILYAFIFLVALGIDYNIFLMTRVREESIKIGTMGGVIKGLVVTGGVITSAGVVLAATFAALAVIPILFLAQLAFVVAFGVLLDTVVVRSLLVPALIRDIGPAIWWPSKLKKNSRQE